MNSRLAEVAVSFLRIPLALAFIPVVLAIAARGDSVIAIWGQNNGYQAINPNWVSGFRAVTAGYRMNYAVTSEGAVLGCIQSQLYPTADYLPGLVNVAAVAAGESGNVALKTDGSVVAFGTGPEIPAGLSGVTAVAAGRAHFLALKSDGTVAGWGDDAYGQATVPAGLSNVVAIAAGEFHSLALRIDGVLVAWGRNDYGQSSVPAGLSNVTAIAGGSAHSLAVDERGKVTAWGWNSCGQADVPADLTNVTAVAAGRLHSVALKSDGTVAVWGDNYFGQVDVLAGLTHVVALSACEYQSVALAAGNVPPFIPKLPTSIQVAPGTRFNLLCFGNGSQPLLYQWRRDGRFIAGATVLPLGPVQASDSGLYSVLISNAFGSIQTETRLIVTNSPFYLAPVTVPAAPRPVFAMRNPDKSPVPGLLIPLFEAEASTNLMDWTALPNALAWSTNGILLQDPAAPGFNGCFYRVRQR